MILICVFKIQAKVEEARQALMEVTRCNTEHLRSVTSLLEQKKELELKLNSRQRRMVISVDSIHLICKMKTLHQ